MADDRLYRNSPTQSKPAATKLFEPFFGAARARPVGSEADSAVGSDTGSRDQRAQPGPSRKWPPLGAR